MATSSRLISLMAVAIFTSWISHMPARTRYQPDEDPFPGEGGRR
jgi:hypothetical protein